MKKLSLIAAVTLSSIIGSAYAADTQAVTVNASITSVCKFTTQAQTINFVAIDPSAIVDQTAPLSVSYKCTNGTSAPTIAAPPASFIALTKGTETMSFTVDAFSATTAGQGFAAAASTVNTLIRIVPAQFQGKTAGAYAGSLSVTINP